MKILIACGGTSGHINPAIAIAREFRSRRPDTQFLFIGTANHLEADLVPRAGFEMKSIDISGMSRKHSLSSVKHNIDTVRKYISAVRTVKAYIREFQPDVAVGTGGYVSAPVMKAACSMGIKTVIHEQYAFAGFVTRMLAPQVDRVLLSFPLARPLNVSEDKVCVVGNPVRREFTQISRQQARAELGIAEHDTVILSCGGSLGARSVNDAFCGMVRQSVKDGLMIHYHAAGREYDRVMSELYDISDNDRIRVSEYIYNMPQIMAAADMVIARSGAGTVTELAACGRASVLIPSPNVTDNHQYYNAKVFADKGAAILMQENDLDGKKLYDCVKDAVFDAAVICDMERAARSLYNPRTNEDIFRIIEQLCG